ncbi:hypothetical protein QQZ08_012541, partial [Neonectria magnoliae]
MADCSLHKQEPEQEPAQPHLREQEAIEAPPDKQEATDADFDENLTSRWQPLLITVDDNLLAGYAKDTATRLGSSCFAGTHTTATCIWGPHIPPHIRIMVKMQNGTEQTHMLGITLKLQSLQAPAEYFVISSSNVETLDRFIPYAEQNLDGLRDGFINKKDKAQFDNLDLGATADEPSFAQHLAALSTHVIHLRFDVRKEDMIVLPSKWFIQHLEDQVAAVQEHGKAIIDAFTMEEKSTITLAFTFPFFPDWKKHWHGAFTNLANLAPFQDICANVRDGADDLAFKNIDLQLLQQPIHSNPASDVFLSRDHRTVALLVGAVEDLAHQQAREKLLFSINLNGRAFADPVSLIKPSDDDVNTYGTRMDGTIYTHQYIAIPLAGIREICPDIGSQVSMYLNLGYIDHAIPQGLSLSASQKQQMARDLESELRSARRRGESAEENCQAQLDKLLSKNEPDPDAVERKQNELVTILKDTFYRHAERHVYPFVKEVAEASRAALPDEAEEVQKWHSARLLAMMLEQQCDEDDIAWGNRLTDWTSKQDIVMMAGAKSELGDAFKATRIPLPHGVRADVALFSVRTPRQSNWMKGFQNPPMKYLIPYTPLTGQLQPAFSSLFDKNGRGTNPRQTFTLKIWYQESDTTTIAECRAITALNSVKENSRVDQWWRYIIDFTNPERVHRGNLLIAFPELAARITGGKYDNDPDTKMAMESLKSTLAGFVVATGCPGAGKSTWATEVCDAVMEGPSEPKGWMPLETSQTTEEDTQETMPQEEDNEEELAAVMGLLAAINDDEEGSVWENGIDQAIRTRLQALLEEQHAAAAAQRRIAATNRKLEQQQDAEMQTGETETQADTSGDGPWDEESTRDTWNNAWTGNTEQSPSAMGNEEVQQAPGWDDLSQDPVTPTNRLAWDARVRLSNKCPGKLVIHVFPWKREVANALNAEAAAPEAADEDALRTSPWQDVTLAHHLAQYNAIRWEELSPAADEMSLSEVAKSIVRDHPESFADAARAMHEFTFDKSMFRRNQAENMEAIHSLLEYTLSKADSIVGTPVAVSEVAHHVSAWKPDIIVIDEAGRLNEAALMIPISEFTDAPCLILGDPNQCTPFNRTEEDKTFADLFGKQRKVSLLDRVSGVDAFNVTLTANHRSHGSVMDFAQSHFYHGRMKIVNQRSQATREMHRYIQTMKNPPPESNSIFIDVQCGEEERIGTSYINTVNSLIVRELAVQLYRDSPLRNMVDYVSSLKDETKPVRRGTIMIITGYANQKRQYEAILDSISPAEIPPGLLTVRTIDDSISAEADIVIVDLVRTTAPGFLSDRKRLAVMTTRARLAQFYVGHAAAFQWQGKIGELVKFHGDKKCMIRIKGERKNWDQWCLRCHQPGHTVASCQFRPKCYWCEERNMKSEHAARDCPDPVCPSEFYEGPIGQVDDVPRSISDFDKARKGSGGKRVKVRNKRRRPESTIVRKEESPAEKRYRAMIDPRGADE